MVFLEKGIRTLCANRCLDCHICVLDRGLSEYKEKGIRPLCANRCLDCHICVQDRGLIEYNPKPSKIIQW